MSYDNFILAFGLGYTELIVIGILGLLIFGNKLPDVGKSLGQGIVQFKKGLKGIQNDIDDTDSKNEKNA